MNIEKEMSSEEQKPKSAANEQIFDQEDDDGKGKQKIRVLFLGDGKLKFRTNLYFYRGRWQNLDNCNTDL